MPKQLLSLMIMISCRSQVYKLVRDLHRIGITHGDLEPRNIARAREGGFYLIDFSESRRHTCKGSKVHGHFILLIGYISGCFIPKTDVFRTANIAKLLVETTAPSRCKFGVKVLMGPGVFILPLISSGVRRSPNARTTTRKNSCVISFFLICLSTVQILLFLHSHLSLACFNDTCPGQLYSLTKTQGFAQPLP